MVVGRPLNENLFAKSTVGSKYIFKFLIFNSLKKTFDLDISSLPTFIGKTLLERMKANVNFGKCPDIKGAMVTIEWQTKNLTSI